MDFKLTEKDFDSSCEQIAAELADYFDYMRFKASSEDKYISFINGILDVVMNEIRRIGVIKVTSGSKLPEKEFRDKANRELSLIFGSMRENAPSQKEYLQFMHRIVDGINNVINTWEDDDNE